MKQLFSKQTITPEELETGRLLFAKHCEFLMGCVALEEIPDLELKEIAFLGRSNVGSPV